jgi:uncharacterized protein (PEP-CTERM system associated)
MHMQSRERASRSLAAHAVAPRAVAVAAWALLTTAAALAQDSAGRGFTVEPSVSARQSFTDNRTLSTNKASEAITELGAGLRVASSRGTLRGSLDYNLTGSIYAKDSDSNELRHFLGAAATAELVDGSAFVDVRASYTQQAISAFGTQAADRALTNSNRTDVASLSVSPRLRGNLGGFASYQVRAFAQTTRAKDTDASDVDSASVTGRLDSAGASRSLGWFAEASHQTSDFKAGRRTFDERVRLGVTTLIGTDLRLGVTAGRERTDLRVLGGASNDTWGLQADWSPSPRTALAANFEHRFFGDAHSVRLTHRTPNTSWAVSTSRDLSDTSSQGVGAFGSAYDLFFRQFAALEPDEAKRDALVRAYLGANNIDPRAVIVGGFLASTVTLKRAQSASVALIGARNTVTLQLSASRDERADELVTVIDDLSTVREVRQRGVTVDWAYRLTPQSSVSLGLGYQRSTSDTNAQQSTLKSLSVLWTAPLGARSTVSAGLRRAEFDSPTSPYDENAIFAALRMSF